MTLWVTSFLYRIRSSLAVAIAPPGIVLVEGRHLDQQHGSRSR